MEHIFSSINRRLRHKHFDTHLLARLALNELAKFLDYEQLEGYIRHSTLYVDLPNEADKILVFQHKVERLSHINDHIQQYDPNKTLQDIRHQKILKDTDNHSE